MLRTTQGLIGGLIGALLFLFIPAHAIELTISCGAVGQERALCEELVQNWTQQTGHEVSVTSPPVRTNERFFHYLISLGEADPEIDVYQIDVIWPGLLADHFIDLKQYIDDTAVQAHWQAIIDNNTIAGRLIGMPWYTDVGVLYYRSDLLEKYGFSVPEDWPGLAETALAIQTQERQNSDSDLWGFVFQAANYEGLTCNALEWIVSHGGGQLVENDGAISVNNPFSALALARVASWVGLITPKQVITFAEEDARILAQQGKAVFMRNWPYAWALLNGPNSPVAGKFEVAPLPKGRLRGRSHGTLGGWQLAVSKYSRHPDEAAQLVKFLTGPEAQKKRAIEGSYAPTIAALYDDPEVLAANPFFAKLKPLLETAIARPASRTGDDYMEVSNAFWTAAYDILQGSVDAQDRLDDLEKQLRLIKARGHW